MGKRKAKWILVVLLLVVFVLYVLLGAVLPAVRQPKLSRAYQNTFDTEACYSDTVSCDRACIIEDNQEALEERFRMISQARERIILSTFEFRADNSGRDVIAALIDAAERGVDVKVLVDGFSAFMKMNGNAYFQALASTENVEVKIYNKINLLTPWKLMGRLHDKYLIVDEDLYLLGGRNTYDYFLGDNGYQNYDREVLVYTTDPQNEESSIHQLEAYFDSVWDLDVCRPFYRRGSTSDGSDAENRALPEKVIRAKEELEERWQDVRSEYPQIAEKADYAAMTYETDKITLLANPTHVYAKEPTVFYSLVRLMEESDREIVIHTPYIICNEMMYESLEEVCEDHESVTLMTNSAANNGNPFGASDYLKNRDRLRETGLQILEYEGGVSYHGKTITMGDELSVVGSFNMDMRSAYLDTELMLVIDSKEVNRQLRGYMQTYEADAVKLREDGTYEVPEGVERQQMSEKRAKRIRFVSWFNWLRFLM